MDNLTPLEVVAVLWDLYKIMATAIITVLLGAWLTGNIDVTNKKDRGVIVEECIKLKEQFVKDIYAN